MEACVMDRGMVEQYASEATRKKVCGAIKAKLEDDRPRAEGMEVSGTLLPGGTDAHVHDFSLGINKNSDGEDEVRMWCSPPYAPGTDDKWLPGAPRITHWHEWASTKETTEDLGHSHKLPDLPDVAVADLQPYERTEDHRSHAAIAEDLGAFYLVKNIVATRVGVSVGQRLLKRRGVVEETVRSLGGAPVVYAHPKDPDGHYVIDVDPLVAPGFAVNERMEGDAALYDAILWKENPPGHSVPTDALRMNSDFVAAVQRGEAVHNSLGTHSKELIKEGMAAAMGSGELVRYESIQVHARVGHVAILSPVIAGRGSCPAPACGAIPDPRVITVEDTVAATGVRREAVLRCAAIASRKL